MGLRRRLQEHVQLRLETARGRRIDLNLTRSKTVKFKNDRGRDRDEVDKPTPQHRRRGDRVFVGERGRVSAWTSFDNETFDVYEDRTNLASMVIVNRTKNGRTQQHQMGCLTIDGVMYSMRPYVRGAISRTPYPPAVEDVDFGNATYRLIPVELRLDFDDARKRDQTGGDGRPNRRDNTTVRPSGGLPNRRDRTTTRRPAGSGSARERPRRTRRETTTRQENSVEVLMVLDYSIYYSWYVSSLESSESAKRQDAIQNIIYYYTNIINGVNMRYSSINESDFAISVNVVGFHIALTPSDSPWTEASNIKVDDSNVLGYTALDSFESWASNEAPLLGLDFDQATLFSSYSFFRYISETDPTKVYFSGLANIEGVCDSRRRTAINHESGEYASIQTAAHELGHNLGAQHDGYGNDCNRTLQYVMATAPQRLTNLTFNNPFVFSSCSIQYFRDHLADLTSTDSNCLLNAPADVAMNITEYPGQRYSVDKQCQIIFGPESFYCGGGSRDRSICREMQCWVAEIGQCYAGVEQRAFEGTTCANQSWCILGQCVSSPRAPDAPESCIYGDYRGRFQVAATTTLNCTEIGLQQPWRCYDNSYATDCCQTCVDVRNTSYPAGCEYGDHDVTYCAERLRRDCYDVNVEQACCARCDAERDSHAPANCQFGNKASWCQPADFKPFECYTSANATCCETCNNYRTGPPGCEYGDRASWCTEFSGLDCSVPDQHFQCCSTCAPMATSSTTTTTTRTTTTSSAIGVTTDVMYNAEVDPCPDGDQQSFCSTMPVSDCYHYPDVCCATCDDHYTGVDGCLYGDRDVTYCSQIGRRDCYDVNVVQTCCARCAAERDTQAPADCQFGDKASWCHPTQLEPHSCYSSDEICCDTCASYRTVQPGCEYGDRVSWCQTYSDLDCSDDQQREQCCGTCAQRTDEPSGSPGGGSCPLGDGANFCSTMPAMDCYYYSDLCCATCPTHYTGVEGCEYGDQVSWCETYVQGVEECARPEVELLCCNKCRPYLEGAVTQAPVCEDNADWCDGLFAGYCYDPAVESTCCARCAQVMTNDASCRYGDVFTWCATEYCSQNSLECCTTCA